MMREIRTYSAFSQFERQDSEGPAAYFREWAVQSKIEVQQPDNLWRFITSDSDFWPLAFAAPAISASTLSATTPL